VSNRAPAPDRSGDSNVYVIEAETGAEPRPVTTFTGPDGGRPAWSPDGQWIAYLQGDEPRFSAYNLNKLAIVPPAGGPARVLTPALDRAVESPVLWSADGQSLIFVVEDDRASYVGRIAAAGGNVEKLTGGRRAVSSLCLGSDGKTALLTATAAELPEVHALEDGAFRRLSRQNDAWLSEVQLGTTEDFTSKSKDGTVVNSLMVKPADFKPGQKYPLLLFIHGGPNGQDEHSFSFDQELFAAQGYVVLAVNYRGSSGRGSAFQKAIYADWCHKEVIDLIGAVDEAIRSGVADPDRLGLGGWSYGGILTDATIAVDQRFKAAVSGAGSSLQLTMYGTDQYILQYEQELGPPWKGLEPWLKVSAAFLRADRIKTPTLFMCGEKDFNVPIAGSEQMYQALKSRGIDTQLVIYPGQFHGITMPSYARDRIERRLAWYNKYLKPAGQPAS
jgi:dipeptidyl aminopeptidase/acylaminoacyl peptidase